MTCARIDRGADAVERLAGYAFRAGEQFRGRTRLSILLEIEEPSKRTNQAFTGFGFNRGQQTVATGGSKEPLTKTDKQRLDFSFALQPDIVVSNREFSETVRTENDAVTLLNLQEFEWKDVS